MIATHRMRSSSWTLCRAVRDLVVSCGCESVSFYIHYLYAEPAFWSDERARMLIVDAEMSMSCFEGTSRS